MSLAWDALDPEPRYAIEPAQTTAPEAGFDREWALELIAHAMERLRTKFEAAGKGALFSGLKRSLGMTEI